MAFFTFLSSLFGVEPGTFLHKVEHGISVVPSTPMPRVHPAESKTGSGPGSNPHQSPGAAQCPWAGEWTWSGRAGMLLCLEEDAAVTW